MSVVLNKTTQLDKEHFLRILNEAYDIYWVDFFKFNEEASRKQKFVAKDLRRKMEKFVNRKVYGTTIGVLVNSFVGDSIIRWDKALLKRFTNNELLCVLFKYLITTNEYLFQYNQRYLEEDGKIVIIHQSKQYSRNLYFVAKRVYILRNLFLKEIRSRKLDISIGTLKNILYDCLTDEKFGKINNYLRYVVDKYYLDEESFLSIIDEGFSSIIRILIQNFEVGKYKEFIKNIQLKYKKRKKVKNNAEFSE